MGTESLIGIGIGVALMMLFAYGGYMIQKKYNEKKKSEGDKSWFSKGDKIGIIISGCIFLGSILLYLPAVIEFIQSVGFAIEFLAFIGTLIAKITYVMG